MCQIACAMQLLEWTNDLVLLSILHFLVKKKSKEQLSLFHLKLLE